MDREQPANPSNSKGSAEVESAQIGYDWRVLDLCCGLGGISLAARELGCEIVAGVDLSTAALESFSHNFSSATTICGDITHSRTVEACRNALQYPVTRKHTIVVSGPPCQGFSVAGPRVQRDPRNRILMGVAHAIVSLCPDAALVENVAALMTSQHRNTLSRFSRTLRNAGYHVTVLRLNAADFGVPQIRHRMICLVSRTPLDGPAVATSLRSSHRNPQTVRQALKGLTRPVTYKGSAVETFPCVANHVAMRHSERVKNKISQIEPGAGPMSYRRLHPDRQARTLISGHRAPPAHYSQARSITPREAARLQGFPDDFVVKGSYSNQLLHITNAVPPPLARAALATLLRLWSDLDDQDR
ncbi:MAG: DNA cytosine methyltransferase [Planctomycetota bacterium]